MANIKVASEAEWLHLRDNYVGGSEVASLFYRWELPDGQQIVRHLYEEPPEGALLLGCLSSFKTGYRMWQEKSGIVQPENLDDVEYVQAGKFLEPSIAAWAADKWAWKLRKVRRYSTHDQVAGWGATLDYEVHEPGMPPVEFKMADAFWFRSSDWIVDGEDILHPPLGYNLQLQHQIGAVNSTFGWIVVCVGGNSLFRGRIERHEPTQERIAQAVESFWNGVKSKTPPSLIADYDAVAKAHAYDSKGVKIDLTGNEEAARLARRYKRWKAHVDRVGATLDNLKARFAEKLGDADKATVDGYRVSWPIIERAEKLIPARTQPAAAWRGALTITEERKA